jgi:geranylgeranyl pyrophosphate synthase
MNELLSRYLTDHLKSASNYTSFQEVLLYASLPAGKLFRPKLACAFFKDLTSSERHDEFLEKNNSPLSLLCCALELHHAYTLVHDDLPAMDDDDMRRGKPSVHKKYNEWQAVLAGDALLHLSHQLITKIDDPHSLKIHQAFSWALGARGLILGQVFDLGGEIQKDFASLIRTHELKTGRLMQMALLGSALLADRNDQAMIKTTLRLGQSIGVSFQLLDDLSECVDELSPHEKEVSPFINFPSLAFARLQVSVRNLKAMKTAYPNTYEYLESYLMVMKEKIEVGIKNQQSPLYQNLESDFIDSYLLPLMALL